MRRVIIAGVALAVIIVFSSLLRRYSAPPAQPPAPSAQELQANFAAQAEAARKDEVARNAPERERLAQEYPETYRTLAAKVGNIDECIVATERDYFMQQQAPMMNPGSKPSMRLTADCGQPGIGEMAVGNK